MAGWDGTGTSITRGARDTRDAAASVRLSVERQSARRMASNVASIEAVPEELLGGIDREWAFAWVRKGYDVYACRDEGGTWYLWLDSRCIELGTTPPGRTPRPRTQQRH